MSKVKEAPRLNTVCKTKNGGIKSRIEIVFVNCHGKNRFMAATDNTFLNQFQVIFLSETWETESKYMPVFKHKRSFVVHAKKDPKGRPYGGLQIYIEQSLEPKFISKSDYHIAIRIQEMVIIGVYFSPTTDFDDVISDLSNLFNITVNKKELIMGGDINLHSNSKEFNMLEDYLKPRVYSHTPITK